MKFSFRTLIFTILAVLALISGFLYFPVTRWVDERLLQMRDGLLTQLDSAISRQVEWEKVSPAIFRGIEIKGLVLRRPDGQGRIHIARLVLAHDVLGFLFSGHFLLTEIRIYSSHLVLDAVLDKDILDLVIDLVTRNEPLPPLTIVGEDVTVSIANQGNTINVGPANFRLQNLGERFSFSLNGNLYGDLKENPGFLQSFGGEVTSWGKFDRHFRDAVLEMTLQNLDTNLFTMARQSFRVSVLNNTITLRTIQSSQPIDVEMKIDRQTGTLVANFRSERFLPSSLFAPKNISSDFLPWLSSEITGEGSIASTQNEFTYSFLGRIHTDAIPGLGTSLWDIDVRGDQAEALVKRLTVQGPRVQASYSGAIRFVDRTASGKLDLERWKLSDGEEVSGALMVQSLGPGSIGMISEMITIGPERLATLSAQMTWNNFSWSGKATLDIAHRQAPQPRSSFDLSWFWEPALDSYQFNVAVAGAEVFWLSRQANGFPEIAFDFLKNWTLSGKWEYRNTRGSVQLGITDLLLVDEDHPQRRLSARGTWNPSEFRLDNALLEWDGWSLQMGLEGSTLESGWKARLYLDSGPLNFQAELNYSSKDEILTLHGDYATKVVWKSGQEGSLTWESNRFPVPTSDVALYLTSSGSARLVPTLHLENGSLLLERDTFGGVKNLRFNTSFQSTGSTIVFQEIFYSDSHSALNGFGELSFPSQNTATLQFLLSSRNGESISCHGLWEPQGLTVRLQAERIPLERILKGNASGRINLKLSANITPTDIQGDAWVDLSQGRLGTDTFSATSRLALSGGVLRIKGLEATYLQQRFTNVSAHLDLAQGTGSLQGDFEGIIGGAPLTMKVNAAVAVGQDILLGSGSAVMERMTGRVEFSNIHYNRELVDDFFLQLTRIMSVTTLRGGVENAFLGRVTDGGDFRFLFQDPFPMTATVEGSYHQGVLSARVNGLNIPASTLAFLFGPGIARIRSGRITGDLTLQGPLSDPNIVGQLEVVRLAGTSPLVTGDFGPVSTSLDFSERGIKIAPTRFRVGEGTALLSGTFFLARWIPERFRFQVTVLEEEAISLTYAVSPLNLVGKVHGNIEAIGNSFDAEIWGDLTLSETKIMLSPDPPERAEVSDFNLNTRLTLRSGNRVEFVWPFANFPIVRAYLNPEQSLYFESSGFSGEYRLRGEIGLRGGEFFYLNQIFFLREGNIQFNENQDRFDPFLNARAELRRRDPQGPVTIILLVNDHMSRFSPRFEAIPPKTPEEITLYIGNTVFSPHQYAQLGFQGALNLAGDLGSSFVLRPFEEAVKDAFHLDFFTIRTQLLQRFVIGGPEGRAPTLEDYLDNTSVFLGKYLGDNLFLEGQFSLSAVRDENNVADGTIVGEAEVGLEMQTPFFLLNWRFVPRNPSQLFIPDNKISLSWRWTY